MRLVWLVVVASACSSEGSPPPDGKELGAAPYSCEEYVDSAGECTPWEDVCRPDICASWDCCYVENNEWRVLHNECFGGCGTPDAGVDAN
jgi:hypothetical protein